MQVTPIATAEPSYETPDGNVNPQAI